MITKEMLKQIAPNSKDSIINDLVKYLNIHMPKYDVDTFLRVCHFLAQAAHESASFRTLEEYASGAAYEGRKDLGNVNKGDGVRYKGRGIFQLTGRANYRQMSKILNVDLENNPELAETPEISVLTALEYWKTRGLNRWADANDIVTITKRINGGTNGLSDRRKYYKKAITIITPNFKFEEKKPGPKPEPQINNEESVLNIIVAKVGDDSSYVADLQEMLNKKGAKLETDGKFGPKTESAVKTFQRKAKLKVTGSIDTLTLNELMKI